jgi:translocator protein
MGAPPALEAPVECAKWIVDLGPQTGRQRVLCMTAYIPFAIFFVLTAAAAMTGGIFTPGPWYLELRKPWWTPPGWAFPLVWTTLYIMIAIAGWLAWKAQGIGLLVGLWMVQLVLNAAWSWIMFGERQIGWALIDAMGMWLSIAAFIVLAWPVSQTAALLFMPYLVWVSVATLLNFEVLRMNPAMVAG